MSRFAFGPFVLDTESRTLLRDGERLPVAGRTLDTLVVLVQNRGRLLEKDELLADEVETFFDQYGYFTPKINLRPDESEEVVIVGTDGERGDPLIGNGEQAHVGH